MAGEVACKAFRLYYNALPAHPTVSAVVHKTLGQLQKPSCYGSEADVICAETVGMVLHARTTHAPPSFHCGSHIPYPTNYDILFDISQKFVPVAAEIFGLSAQTAPAEEHGQHHPG